MAIQYLGTTISGVAADAKPTLSSNENGVVFIETDTNKTVSYTHLTLQTILLV